MEHASAVDATITYMYMYYISCMHNYKSIDTYIDCMFTGSHISGTFLDRLEEFVVLVLFNHHNQAIFFKAQA